MNYYPLFANLRGVACLIVGGGEVAAAARAENKLCNIVDDPSNSSFIVPAIIERSPAVLAISTGGEAPLLAHLLHQRLEQWLPTGIGDLTRWAGRWRRAAKMRLAHPDTRRRFLEKALTGRAAAQVLRHNEALADEIADNLLETTVRETFTGHAWLVGWRYTGHRQPCCRSTRA